MTDIETLALRTIRSLQQAGLKPSAVLLEALLPYEATAVVAALARLEAGGFLTLSPLRLTLAGLALSMRPSKVRPLGAPVQVRKARRVA